jgi:hypothetical protein
MGSEAVRAAIVDYFAPPNIAGLRKVYPAMPYWAGGDQWEFAEVDGWACVGFVHLTRSDEQRIGLGGEHGGQKFVHYDVGLVLLYKWLIPDPIPQGSDATEWTVWIDQIIDAVKDRIRADRTFGCEDKGPIWQAGDGSSINSPDISVQRDLPRLTAGKVQSWQVVEFTVTEAIIA